MAHNDQHIEIIHQDGFLDYYPKFMDQSEAKSLFDQIQHWSFWRQHQIIMFGKKINVPRLEAYFALDGVSYGYSGQALEVQEFPPFLLELLQKVSTCTQNPYNAVLVNFYRDQQDSNGWHADNEKSLGKNPSIASLSLGAARPFELKHMASGDKIKIMLENGSLLHMHGALQHHYKHQLPKLRHQIDARINLTFRWVHPL